MARRKTTSAKPRKQRASKLITKNKSYAMKATNAKRITVSTWDGSGRYGYSNKYIANTKANRDKIIDLMGKPELHNGKYIWF